MPKERWQKCYDTWYKDEFLQGAIEPKCRDEWEEYKECVTVRVRRSSLLLCLAIMDWRVLLCCHSLCGGLTV